MEIACEKHGWRRKRYGGKSLELACGKHRWIRDGGKDKRCGWEIGWEKWKGRYGGRSMEIACAKHRGEEVREETDEAVGK